MRPAAVVEVCVPWPSESRGDRKSLGSMTAPAWKPAANQRAPISLLLQSVTAQPSPAWQAPFQLVGGVHARVVEARMLLHGAGVDHADDDALAAQAIPAAQAVGLAEEPEKFRGVVGVQLLGPILPHIASRSCLSRSRAACEGVSLAAKPFRAWV